MLGLRAKRFRTLSLISSSTLLVALILSFVVFGGSAQAAPALSVGKSGGSALLGGQATVRITVTNNGDSRGYNLGVTDTFTSVPLRGDGKNKTVTFVSASGPGGALTPTSVTTNPTTNALTVQFDDIKDLAPTESATINIVISPSDPTWAVGDKMHDVADAKVNDRADGGGTWRTGSASADTNVLPIELTAKSANQSTADDQATGCGELIGGRWPYSYTITAQNNYVNQTDNVVVTDVIPDGIEYFGVTTGPAPTTAVRSNTTGQWTLTWNLGTMAASASFSVTYSVGIRYDYFGTANGGTNRAYDNYTGTPLLGTPVPDQTTLHNTADLTCTYLGTPYSDSKDASVIAAYATIHKGVSPGSAHNGETVHFALTYSASEYYNLSNFSIVDVVPDGLTYTVSSASPAPDLIENDTPGPGQTRLTWNTPAKVPSMFAGGQATVTFDATVDNTWSVPPTPGHTWVVAGDAMTNHVTMNCDWSDTRQSRTGHSTDLSSSTVVAVGPTPPVIKEAALDNAGSPGTYSHAIKPTVGDTVWFRVRMNTNDGANPVVPTTQFGDVDVVDWIPQGTQFVAGSATMTYSTPGGSYFLYDPPNHPVGKYSARYADQPAQISSGSLQGLAWSLGDVAPGGWWQVVFKVVVQDDAAVVNNAVVYDYGKTSWATSNDQQSSARDVAGLTYAEPDLTAAKAVISTPANPGAGQDWGYRITLTNSGTAAARNVLVTDTLPAGMRNFDPTSGTVTVKRGSTTLSAGTDYTLSYTPATGQFLVDFDNGSTIRTEIPPPPSTDNVVTIEYTSRVDSTVGAGASLTNNASITYSAQNAGSTPNRDYGPVTASATITLPNITIAKSIVGSSTVPIGTGAASEVTYRLTVTVPANNLATGTGINRLRDVVNQDGLEYVTGSTLLTDDSGTPPTPALFSDLTNNMDASVNWTSPNPGSTLTWMMRDLIDNSGQATAYVFQVDFKLRATGLITPVSQGGSATNPANWRFWPNTGGNPTLNNTATDSGNFRWGDSFTNHTATSNTSTTTLQQPYMQLSKTNNKVGPPEVFVKAGDTVNYTITAHNAGKSASYNNVVVDTLPVGMRDTDPSGTVAVTVDGAPVAFATGWNGTTGGLTVTVNAGVSVPAGKDLVVTYTATVDGDVGSGATLTNRAYIEYRSEAGAGRHVTKDDDSTNSNKASSQVRTPQATMDKFIDGPNPATIGDTVVYRVRVTVPNGTDLYGPTIVDVINRDGIEYVAGSSSLTDISGTPGTPASFSGSSNPTTDYNVPNPGATFTWSLNDVKNGGAGSDYVFDLQFSCKVTGLIDPAGSVTDPDNWVWWWTHSGNPTADNTASDTGTVNWNDGVQDRTASTPTRTQHVYQPNLELTKSNNSGGAVLPGGTIGYTIDMTNNGLSTSYRNILVDTFPAYMRDTDPSGSVAATLNLVPLTPGVNFTTSWNGTTGNLTVDFTAGSGGATDIPAGQTLTVTYTGTVNSQVGAGSTLRNMASVEFNSRSDGTGRHVPTNSDVSQRNTDDSTADIPPATIAKTQNAAGGQSAIGQPYTYTVNVTVPAHTTIYNSTVTDTVVDGLAVDGTSTYLDGAPQTIGTVNVTGGGGGTTNVSWNIGDHTNNTGSAQLLGLHIDVHIKTTFNGGGQVRGLPPQSTFANSTNLGWDDASSGGAHHVGAASATSVTATEPHLVLTKTNDVASPVPGGQTVHYTVSAQNTGTSTSCKNVLVDTLPAGMRNIPPTVTNVTLAGVPLTENTDYWVTWNSGTGELTVDLDHGVSKTNIQTGVGNRLMVYINATPSADVGSGATLTNTASIGYNSWSGSGGRATARTSNPADDNTKTSSITIRSATMTKTQNAPANKANIGQPFTYTVSVAAPAYTTLYNAQVTDTTPDGISVDATSTYVDGSPQTVGTVTAVPQGSGTTIVTWNIGSYTNNTASTQQVQLHLDVHIKTTLTGGAPVRGLPPQTTFANTANLGWDDAASGGGHHTTSASATSVTTTEPHLVLTKSNNATGPVVGGQPVNYTINVTNTGTGTSYQNVLVDTLPVGMRGNTPSVTSVTLGGLLLAENTNYTVNWNSGNGQLTVDLTAGSAGASNIQTGTGNKLVVKYTASASDDAGSGATLTNTASIGYNSWSGAGGRATARTVNPADDNTKTSSITVQGGSIFTKTHNAVGNVSNIGQSFTYTLAVSVPAHTSIYNGQATDTVADGLAVDATSTFVNGIPQTIGTVTVTPQGNGTTNVVWNMPSYTNSTDATAQVQLHIDVHIKTTFHDSTPVNGLPPGQSVFANSANFGWDDAVSGGNHHTASGSANNVTAAEPHLVLTKVNDATGPVAGGDPVHYTVTMTNTGTGTSYQNVLVDTLPEGMRGNTPIVTSVTVGGITLTEGVNYTVSWDPGTGALTVDLTAGSAGPSNIQTGSGKALVVSYTASASNDAGASATLSNIASVGYNSWSGSGGRATARTTNPADDNTKTSSITCQPVTASKIQNAPGNQSTIGQPFSYTLGVSVPRRMSAYNVSASDTIPDGLAVDGTTTYVDGIPQTVGTVTVTPQGNGTTDIAWNIGNYTNITSATQQLQLKVDVHIKTAFNDSTPVRGLPPQSVFSNTMSVGWDDHSHGGGHHTASASATNVTATEPHLVLTKTNDAAGPVSGGQPVRYTITVENTGTSTSCKNVMVDTLPAGMRGNTPTVTGVTLGGSFLTEGQNYTVNWNSGTGALTVDLTAGSGGATNIPTGPGNALVISVTASASDEVGAGATLTNIASIGYNSWSGSSGRQTNRTSNPADDNTKTSSITIQSATLAKTQNATDNAASIGSTFNYTIAATVPARTTIYNAQATDSVRDGLTVTSVSTAVGSAAYTANPDGTTSVTWTIGNYTNSTDNPASITLVVGVRVDKKYNNGDDVESGDTFGNGATLSWEDAASGGGTHNASGSASDVIIREPRVTMNKTVDNETPAAGDTVTYTIVVQNEGNWPAYNVAVQDTVDSALTYVPGSITGPGTGVSGSDLSWDFQAGLPGPLNAGQSANLTFQATVNGGAARGTVVPNAVVLPAYYSLLQPNTYARQYAQVQSSRDITVRAPVLAMNKTVVSGGNPDWGENVTYRLTVTNNGDATASHIGVRDTIPSPHFSYVTGSTSASWPGGSSTADPTGTSPTFAWDLDATLAPAQQLTLEFQMSVDQWASFGTHTNSGTGFGKDGGGSDLPEATATADINVRQHPAIGVTKTLNSPIHYVPIGSEFTYTIQVTNQGNTRIPVVPLADTYDPVYMQYVDATPTPTTNTPGHLAWTDISSGNGLDPQESASVTVTFKALRAGATPNTDDTAAVSTEDDQHNPVSGSATNNQLVITNPGIAVTKTLNHPDNFIPVGGTATYTIHVANAGDTAVAAPVQLADGYNPAYLGYASATPTPDNITAGTLTWNDISGGAGIAVGGSMDVTVTFKALRAGATPNTDDIANVVATDEHGVPISGQVTNDRLTITHPALTVAKAVKAGQKTPVNVNDNVVFVITVSNSGDTVVPAPVPMSDTYNSTYMEFVSATVAHDLIQRGSPGMDGHHRRRGVGRWSAPDRGGHLQGPQAGQLAEYHGHRNRLRSGGRARRPGSSSARQRLHYHR